MLLFFFRKEIESKRKMLENTIKNIEKRIENDQIQKSWNPGGGIFTDCIGCGEKV